MTLGWAAAALSEKKRMCLHNRKGRRIASSDEFDAIPRKPEPGRQQRPKYVVAAGSRKISVEEDVRRPIRSLGNRRVPGRRPASGGAQKRLRLLDERPEGVVGNR